MSEDKSDELAKLALNPKEVLSKIPKERRLEALKLIMPYLLEMRSVLEKYQEINESQNIKQEPTKTYKLIKSDDNSTDDEFE